MGERVQPSQRKTTALGNGFDYAAASGDCGVRSAHDQKLLKRWSVDEAPRFACWRAQKLNFPILKYRKNFNRIKNLSFLFVKPRPRGTRMLPVAGLGGLNSAHFHRAECSAAADLRSRRQRAHSSPWRPARAAKWRTIALIVIASFWLYSDGDRRNMVLKRLVVRWRQLARACRRLENRLHWFFPVLE